MISPSHVSSSRQPHPTPASKPRLLIISDSSERLTNLRASLSTGEIEITSATSPAELRRACRSKHDLAVVDVGPTHLGKVLEDLRSSKEGAEIPVLVEASRLAADPGLVGVLPKYRAMPCSHADLVTLARRRIASTTGRRHGRKLL